MSKLRYYVVTDKANDPPIRHLVRAPNRTAALRHIVARQFGVWLASQEELIALTRSEIDPEEVGAPEPGAPPDLVIVEGIQSQDGDRTGCVPQDARDVPIHGPSQVWGSSSQGLGFE